MKVGIDGDVLRYELGAVAMEKEQIFDFVVEKPWPVADVRALVDDRIRHIIDRTGASSSEIFLTGAGNFRIDLATIKPYKGQRAGLEKPYHWQTVSDYLLELGARVCHGVEADDALAMLGAHYGPDRYTIASRDKDLRMSPCRHYSWACGETQPEIGPFVVVDVGYIECVTREYVAANGKKKKVHKIKGCGLKFFYAQLLVGDAVDNIGGCPRVGPVRAFELLQHLTTEQEMFQVAAAEYHRVYGDEWKPALEENARLLWLIQDRSWVDIAADGNNLTFTVNKFWECPYDYSQYDSGAAVCGVESSSEQSSSD